jgi:hypothetical protein
MKLVGSQHLNIHSKSGIRFVLSDRWGWRKRHEEHAHVHTHTHERTHARAHVNTRACKRARTHIQRYSHLTSRLKGLLSLSPSELLARHVYSPEMFLVTDCSTRVWLLRMTPVLALLWSGRPCTGIETLGVVVSLIQGSSTRGPRSPLPWPAGRFEK